MNETILNQGLSLAMEWGEHWLKPIQERLAVLHPELSKEELDGYNEVCRQAMFEGFEILYTLANPNQGENSSDVSTDRMGWMMEKYPWINKDNLSRLYSQGMYYAMK